MNQNWIRLTVVLKCSCSIGLAASTQNKSTIKKKWYHNTALLTQPWCNFCLSIHMQFFLFIFCHNWFVVNTNLLQLSSSCANSITISSLCVAVLQTSCFCVHYFKSEDIGLPSPPILSSVASKINIHTFARRMRHLSLPLCFCPLVSPRTWIAAFSVAY